jgi:hypothetical protein
MIKRYREEKVRQRYKETMTTKIMITTGRERKVQTPIEKQKKGANTHRKTDLSKQPTQRSKTGRIDYSTLNDERWVKSH